MNSESNTSRFLKLLCISSLALSPTISLAQDVRYAGGAGQVLEGTKSADGEFAVVLDGNGDNVVVSLREKRQAMKLTAEDDWQFPYFPGLNHGSLDVTWGPDQEGNRFGVLMYGAKWETAKVILVDVNGEFGSQANIKPVLRAAAVRSAAAAGSADAEDLAYSFEVAGVDAPGGDMVIGDPLDIRIGYVGEMPKAEDVPLVRGTLKVRLSRGADGPAVKLIGGGPAPETKPDPAAAAERFKALRAKISEEVEGDGIRKVKVHPESKVPGRSLSYMGHLEANVLKRLVYVDSEDEENETYVLYYWQDGLLVSVFEVREGKDTEMSEVAKTIEVYNFENQKLVGWIRDDVPVDSGDVGFAETGQRVLDESIERGGVIYLEIGAD